MNKIFKRLVSVFVSFILGTAIIVATAQTAAAGNCTNIHEGHCKQFIIVNTVSARSITVSYGAGTPNYYLGRATSHGFICGTHAGLNRFYVHKGYNVRVKGYFGANKGDIKIYTFYYRATGWHEFPANFRPPKCTYRSEPFADKYGLVKDILEYRE